MKRVVSIQKAEGRRQKEERRKKKEERVQSSILALRLSRAGGNPFSIVDSRLRGKDVRVEFAKSFKKNVY